ncbi:MAG: TonB-dependent receptor, partial [Steroidobacteraceae bacterium]|nr:TonB-dependent receptor [Steroidobacteraceae bacterium]
MKKIPFASGFVLTLFATIGGAEGNETAKVLTLDEVLVTGTHIRGVESASPVVIYDAQHIEQSGYSSVQQFLASIPQNWTGAASDQGASAQVATTDHSFPGESSPNIHGLGSGATLTLVNGQRLAAAGYGINADLSMVPLSAIERIELVTDGASALYGSDAIAGVVNIVLKESLAGAETVAEYGGATSGGHTRMRVAQSLGRDWSGGHGLISYEYSGQSALEAEDREFSPPSIVGAYLAPEMKRHSGFATVRQDVGAHTELFGSVLYAHKRTDSLNVLRSASSNTADQYAATGGVRRNLAKTWTLSISGSLGDSQMSELSRFGAAISGDAVVDAGHWSASALLQGELLPLPGGAIKLAAGSEYREERLRKFNRAAGVRSMDERRTVEAGFAELNIPLFGGENRRQLLHELTFSAAARFERYSDFGDTSNEKLGIRWRATPSVLLRGTTGTAFNAPSLLTMATPTQAVVFPLQDPLATPGPTTPSLLLLGAERELDAETGRSTTVGLDIRPAGVPSLQLSLTYFETRYSGRIQAPAPTFIGMLINEHDYADLITRDPSLDVVNALIAGSDS